MKATTMPITKSRAVTSAMPSNQPHAVIVLASGLSARLGQAKQLLSKNSEPLICHMLKVAHATKPQAIIVVTPKSPAIRAAIAQHVAEPSIYPIINDTPQAGMAHSLTLGVLALTRLDTPITRVLIMGVDQVLLDTRHLLHLLASTQTVVASGYLSLAADFSDRPTNQHLVGLPINIDFERLQAWQPLLTGDKGLRHLLRALPPHQIRTVHNQQLSYDIDTPEQLAYARCAHWLDDAPI